MWRVNAWRAKYRSWLRYDHSPETRLPSVESRRLPRFDGGLSPSVPGTTGARSGDEARSEFLGRGVKAELEVGV